jgi:putative hemolysin
MDTSFSVGLSDLTSISPNIIYLALLIPVLLVCSAFFSGSEVAFFSLNPASIEEKSEDNPLYRRIASILKSSKRLLITLLVGNTIVNVCISLIGAVISEYLIELYQLPTVATFVIDVFVITLMLLIFGEITPKIIAANNPERFALRVSTVINVLMIAFYPFTEAALQLTRFLEGIIFRLRGSRILEQRELSDEDVEVIAALGLEKANLQKAERQLIDNVLDFREKSVRKIMTPRTDINAINVEMSLPDAIALVMQTKHSRFPMYEENLDKILGVIYAKDLIKHLSSRRKFDRDYWLKMVRQPIFIPESQRLDDVLREFQKRRMHLAIVVDEYGGTAGIVTLQDVIEEIVSELSPTPVVTSDMYRKLSETDYWFDAGIPLDEASEVMNISKEILRPVGTLDADYDTLGGLILSLTGEIPDEKQRIPFAQMDFEIEKLEGNRILSIIIHKPLPSAAV